jgi:hypothetical protein
MRVVKEIGHPHCKITIYAWNNRYLLKLEQGLLEQTFKIDQFDIANEEALTALLDETFIREALDRFQEMHASLSAARERMDG